MISSTGLTHLHVWVGVILISAPERLRRVIDYLEVQPIPSQNGGVDQFPLLQKISGGPVT